MAHNYQSDGPFEDIAREIKQGIKEFAQGMKQFAREISEEARAYEEKHGNPFTGPTSGPSAGPTAEPDHGCCGDKEFRFHFDDALFPRCNVYRNEDKSIVYEFILPGFDESCIDLSFKGDTMILKASLPEHLRRKEGEDFRRRFTLRDIERREYNVPAERYDQAAAKAVFRNGILTVTIPPKEEDMSDAVRVKIVKDGN